MHQDKIRNTLHDTTVRRSFSDTFHPTQRKVLDDNNLSKSMSSNFHYAKMETLRKHEEKAIALGIKTTPSTGGTRVSSPVMSSGPKLILSSFTTAKTKPDFDAHYHRDLINQVKGGRGDAYKSFKSHLNHSHVYVTRPNETNPNEKPTKQRIKWTQKQVEMRKLEKEKEDFVHYNQRLADPKIYQTIRSKGEFNNGLKHERIW